MGGSPGSGATFDAHGSHGVQEGTNGGAGFEGAVGGHAVVSEADANASDGLQEHQHADVKPGDVASPQEGDGENGKGEGNRSSEAHRELIADLSADEGVDLVDAGHVRAPGNTHPVRCQW